MEKLEDYLKNRCQNEQSTKFLTQELVGYLRANSDQINQGQKWNTTVINAVVVYVGTQAIKQIQQNQQNPTPSPETVAHNACMDIYQVIGYRCLIGHHRQSNISRAWPSPWTRMDDINS